MTHARMRSVARKVCGIGSGREARERNQARCWASGWHSLLLAAVLLLGALTGFADTGWAQSVSDGSAAYKEGDILRARDIWQTLAEDGDPEAQFNLGKLYESGGGELQQDYSLAAQWYSKAAARDFAAAQNNLGLMHSQGLGVSRDARRAAELWKRAAENGYRLAQYNLGRAYFRGEGVERNERLAAVWFEKGAKAGLAEAQYAMGLTMRLGRAAGRDDGQALTWYKLAADQGHAAATQQVAELENRGVIARAPVPILQTAPAAAATPETAQQSAAPEATSQQGAALNVQPAEGEGSQSGESSQQAVAATVPVPAAKPEPPAEVQQQTATVDSGTNAETPTADAASGGTQTAALPEADAEPEVRTISNAASGIQVWLFSADSAAEAGELRDQTQARHGGVLGPVELGIFEVDYGERGHFYRVMAGPLKSVDAADELCRQLRADEPQGFCKVLAR